eukprot:m.154987 g.154987  ORF g.154987 m.154987 type:complete len:86 (-) comp16265_c1_seq2:1413-1670(-)
MDVVLVEKKGSTAVSGSRVHSLPCTIHHDGRAQGRSMTQPSEDEESKAARLRCPLDTLRCIWNQHHNFKAIWRNEAGKRNKHLRP